MNFEDKLIEDYIRSNTKHVITIKDIINNNYNEDIFIISPSNKWKIVRDLINTKTKHIEKVRSFIFKLGEEYLLAFDILWINKSKRKAKTLAKIKINKMKNKVDE